MHESKDVYLCLFLMTQTNFYSLLGCKRDAAYEEIKRNYKELILKCHPDKTAGNDRLDSKQTQDFVLLNQAWKVLSDPILRRRYDAGLFYDDFESQGVVYDEVCLDDMIKDAEGDFYYTCRCGSHIYAPKFNCGEVEAPSPILLDCEQCSHVIKLIFSPK